MFFRMNLTRWWRHDLRPTRFSVSKPHWRRVTKNGLVIHTNYFTLHSLSFTISQCLYLFQHKSCMSTKTNLFTKTLYFFNATHKKLFFPRVFFPFSSSHTYPLPDHHIYEQRTFLHLSVVSTDSQTPAFLSLLPCSHSTCTYWLNNMGWTTRPCWQQLTSVVNAFWIEAEYTKPSQFQFYNQRDLATCPHT